MAFNNTLALATTQVDKEKTADTTSLFQLAQTFAGAIGTAVTAVIANQAPNMTKGTQNVFTLLLSLVIFVFLSYLLLFKKIATKKLWLLSSSDKQLKITDLSFSPKDILGDFLLYYFYIRQKE